jgi:hypothetical protein
LHPHRRWSLALSDHVRIRHAGRRGSTRLLGEAGWPGSSFPAGAKGPRFQRSTEISGHYPRLVPFDSPPPIHLDNTCAANTLREVLVWRANDHPVHSPILRGFCSCRCECVVGFVFDHRPNHDAERLQSLLEQDEVAEQLRFDPFARLVPRPEPVPK